MFLSGSAALVFWPDPVSGPDPGLRLFSATVYSRLGNYFTADSWTDADQPPIEESIDTLLEGFQLMMPIREVAVLHRLPRLAAVLLLLCVVNLSPGSCARAEEKSPQPIHQADVIIYGGTSAGVAAAVETHRLGKTAIIIEPLQHLGGLTSSGLGWTDSGDKNAIGGISLEFYERVKLEYDKPETWKWQDPAEYKRYQKNDKAIWVFEPHIAERVFEQFVDEYKIPVFKGERLDLKQGVSKEGTRITEIRMESGLRFQCKKFIDATYEGDLLALSKVKYTVGREANSQYNETLNGVQKARTISHQFTAKVSPYRIPDDPSSGLLPGVHGDDPGEDGTGDHRVQAYCFRMCLSNHPDNRLPFPKPDNYDPLRYELLARYLDTGWSAVFNKFDVIPNRKTDTNNHGAFSTDNIGMNYAFPEGDYATRDKIIQEHTDYQLGLMWFLANDPRVPEPIQTRMNQWGLAKDEFLDNNHWPHQIYVREARRMVSDFVMSERHLRRLDPTPEPIGMGSYNMDSHNVQRYVTPDGYARNEGDIQVNPGGPYPVSYRAIVPKADECTNLLVPVCLSSSHIAYGSIRMEPVFMILAHSAAAAACQAIDRDVSVQEVDYVQLKEQLVKEGQVLDYNPPRREPKVSLDPKSLPGMVIDNSQARLVGDWGSSQAANVFVGTDYLHDGNSDKGAKSATFEFTVTKSGKYDVRLAYPQNPNRATNVTVEVQHLNGSEQLNVNQQKAPTLNKTFISLGAFEFSNTDMGRVIISNANTNGYVIADAVWLVPVTSQDEK